MFVARKVLAGGAQGFSPITGFCAGLGIVFLGLVAAVPALAATPPTIDGNIDDLLQFATDVVASPRGCLGTAVNVADLAGDICSDGSRIPCNGFQPTGTSCAQYFPNGFDLTRAVAAYEKATGDLFLGFRVAGSIGDSDGDLNHGAVGPCSPATTITDVAGISAAIGESYKWFIDTNCDNTPEFVITASGGVPVGDVTVSIHDFLTDLAVPGAAGTGKYVEGTPGGHDLEVRVTGLTLPAIWELSTEVDSDPDRLGEDGSDPATTPPPDLNIDVEKTASPATLCPGQTTTFTITVENTGCGDLSVTLQDIMPPGFTFANAVTGDFTPDLPPVGQTLTFNDLAIKVGETKTVSFDATAPADCFGLVDDEASVTGRFDPGEGCPADVDDVSDSDIFTLTCRDNPCVDQVMCDLPTTPVCVGQTFTVTGSARNCSQDPEDITITIRHGATVLETCTFNDVPAGESRSCEVDDTCSAPGTMNYQIEAVAENATCGTTDPVTSNCSVTCKDNPCVDQVQCDVPTTPQCVGATFTVTGSAHNCSTEPEDITITIRHDATVLETCTFNDVPAGESRSCEVDDTCSAPGTMNYQIEAVAATETCGATDPVTSNCSVTCRAGPCVDQVQCDVPTTPVCVGSTFNVTGSAHNCSAEPEDITITIRHEGTVIETCTFTDVPAGESRSCPVEQTCTAPGSMDFEVEAVAANATCGQTDPETSSCTVICRGNPCVDQVVCNVPTAPVCVGNSYTVSASARNCSQEAEDITLTIRQGTTVIKTCTFENVQAGASRSCEVEETCTAPGLSSYEIEAVAENSCGETDPVTQTCEVTCQECERLCRLTGGGCLNEVGAQKGRKQHTFGGNASPEHSAGGPTGNEWQHVVRQIPGNSILFNFHSHDAHVVDCSIVEPGPCSPHGELTRADFEGTGLYSEGAGAREFACTFTAIVIDHNEGSCERDTRDEYFIQVVDVDPASPRTGVVFTFPLQRTDCGNLQIHETPFSIFGGLSATPSAPVRIPPRPTKETTDPEPEPTPDVQQVGSLKLLNRAVPNPFSGATSYSYLVQEGGSQAVDVSVYSVTGKLVTRLVSGTQAPGFYTVRWEGRSDDGTKMSQGIYFIRARIGTETHERRLTLLR